MQLDSKKESSPQVIFAMGFRPFFSAAGLFAIVAMLLWWMDLVFSVPFTFAGLASVNWHAHEMIYGYTMAVVAGFLLTAVENWTGVKGLSGPWLGSLFGCWLVARLVFFLPVDMALPIAGVADLLFMVGLAVGVSLPVIRVRQWKQMGIITKLWLLIISSGLFYAGAMGYLGQGMVWGLYAGFYLILGLLFTIARRILPFFIGRGVNEDFTPSNQRWVDIVGPILFILWAILDVFSHQDVIVACLSVLLVLLHIWRMYGWYTPGIWAKPLLWVLYLGYGFLVFGFLLKALSIGTGLSPQLALHAFAVGGIGLMTMGMMSRVTLGHTGRSVFSPPGLLAPMFLLVLMAVLLRVVFPMLDDTYDVFFMAASQLAWVLGFGLFSVVYLPILLKPGNDPS